MSWATMRTHGHHHLGFHVTLHYQAGQPKNLDLTLRAYRHKPVHGNDGDPRFAGGGDEVMGPSTGAG